MPTPGKRIFSRYLLQFSWHIRNALLWALLLYQIAPRPSGACYDEHMRNFLNANISWLYKYFDQNKSLLEIFSLFIIAQTFMYDIKPEEISANTLSAFKIIFWVFIFLVLFLLAIKTAFDVEEQDSGKLTWSLFRGAAFAKNVMRLLTFTLFLAAIPILTNQLRLSIHNRLFYYFWFSLILLAVSEVIAFIATLVLNRKK